MFMARLHRTLLPGIALISILAGIFLWLAGCDAGSLPSAEPVQTPPVVASTTAAELSATPVVQATAALSATTPSIPTGTSTAVPAAAQVPTPPSAAHTFAGLLAFVSDRFDHAEIYLYDLDRNEIIQWTSDNSAKRNPSWAPDGRTLAYGALRDGSWQIYKKSISGGRETRLTSPPGENYEPAWSPDGKSIAFTSNRDGREQVYVMDSEGRNARNVSKSSASDFQPAWSPDGKLLAFSTNRDGNWEIYTMNSDGSNPRNLTHSYAGDWSPAWSPDGGRIAFVSDRDGRPTVYVSALNSTESAVSLAHSAGADWGPAWSPDGQSVAFTSKRDGNFELYVVGADGSNLRRLTTDPGDDIQPIWRWEPGKLPTVHVPALVTSTTSVKLDEGPKMTTMWHFDDNSKLDGMRSSTLQALGQNESGYPTSSGLIFGFEPGDLYQQIYVRDQSWMSIAAMFFYQPQYVRDPIEEFLRRQYTDKQAIRPEATSYPGDGAIAGLFSPEITYDKHTTTSDEEANLIRAAYVYWSMSGDRDWLKKDINGQSVLARLNRAMEWLLINRIEASTSLIWRAHTTDWGDVKIEKTGSPTEFSLNDARTASIFDQAMVYQALLNLSAMNQAAGNRAEADRYQNAASDLKGQVEKYLWQPTKGFYRTHLHLTPLEHKGFDEDSIVSIVNALLVYTGVSDRTGPLDKLEEATKAMGAIKPGLSLYPPYPNGVFAYIQMAEGAYQNGGLWDWWGGTQITAEFEHGLRTRAINHLYQVADDWVKHPRDIYEWQSPRTGFNHGSDNYGGSVATMTEAIIRGLYGIKLETQNVSISSRLGEHNGWVRAKVPASGLYAAYHYQVNGQTIQMAYDTNAGRDVPFRVALPPNATASKVTIDGQTTAFKNDVITEDSYAVFSGPSGPHTIELTLSK
jgi:TolB protein